MARTKKASPSSDSTVVEAPKEKQVCTKETCAPSLSDPFKPLGKTVNGSVVTRSYAAEIAGVVYLKTVTQQEGGTSEALVALGEGLQIVESNVAGYYKVV